ncbi:PAS domain S-box protein [Archangium minus]|uniref:histidine kinase n=1 Tax=Archangium minus TaxID=83450 RepID=A0ABY9X468_9BACT|nr:PAS domain S-box protein [Archangium minus]
MRWSPRAGLLSWLDGRLSEAQRQLPPEELGRYRVLIGATCLLLAMDVLFLVVPLGSQQQASPIQRVMGFGCLVGYLLVLLLVRWVRSLHLPSFILCSTLTASFVVTTLIVENPNSVSHAAGMLVPILSVYLLGARLGFVFTAVFIFNTAFFHQFYHSGFGQVRPLFADGFAWMKNAMAALCLLLAWSLSWLYSTAREESHAALERALKTLRENEGKLLSLIESTDDLVLALDLEGRLVTANHVARELFHQLRNRAVLTGGSLHELSPPEERWVLRERFAQAVTGQRLRTEVSLPVDGRIRTLEITFNPVWEGRRVVGMTVFGRDISERKEAEARLEEMHRSLLDVSRHAGMAEIATGVLHNVGNALNSVNVSADVVVQRVRGSRVVGLERAVELLRENGSSLGTFLTEDLRGRQLPAYLEALSAQLQQEREGVLEEMRRLSESVDHIKSVVSMQQKHARFSGVTERVEVPGLIDDALRLLAVSFDRLGIQLRREYCAQVPPVLVDRHKLLQILVNLVSNARHALLESGRQDKQLTLRVERAGEMLRIAVADNGVGIAPENVPRLFTQGFTTKTEGHGFGLHISALEAEEMGGALTCESGGPGQGATFRLELPLS